LVCKLFALSFPIIEVIWVEIMGAFWPEAITNNSAFIYFLRELMDALGV
jgi:hypothetical protein